MDQFLSTHEEAIVGTLSTFDRMIFKGHLTKLFPDGAIQRFLGGQGVLLKEFKGYVTQVSAQLKDHAQQVASEAERPFIYLSSAATAASGQSKEELARAIAAEEGVEEGLICVFSVLEPCSTFTVRGNRQTHKLEVVRRKSKCLHFYFYYMDAELGFMHIRVQSWFPFQIQVYINGHEWLARQLDRQDIAYERHDNCFLQIADLAAAQALCDRFAHRKWPRLLDALARQVNPFLATIRKAGFGGYYWCLDQCEYATDVMFRDRASLMALYPSLVELAMTAFGADDVLRFLGRKLHGNFKGAVSTHLKGRPEGRRVKHRMKRNSLKMYDKLSVLRVETTINNPREFKVLQVRSTPQGRKRRWVPMGKGVANTWRYRQVALLANRRYLDALTQAQPKGKAVAELDSLCQPRVVGQRRYARFNPVAAQDCQLFAAVLAGDHLINGFRNKDLQTRLYGSPPTSSLEARRRSARISRLLAKLRGHGLIKKVKNCRLYRITKRGYRLMTAALYYRQIDFPTATLALA